MSTSRGPASVASAVSAAILDPETARLQHRVRIAVIELLAAATPSGWEVVDSSTWATMTLDIAVRPDNRPEGQSSLPVLCVDLTAGEGTDADRRRQQRRHALARLGVDHYWDLDTQAKTLDVYVRTDDEYRRAERLTGVDRVDYGIGLLHLDLPLLLESHAERRDEPRLDVLLDGAHATVSTILPRM